MDEEEKQDQQNNSGGSRRGPMGVLNNAKNKAETAQKVTDLASKKLAKAAERATKKGKGKLGKKLVNASKRFANASAKAGKIGAKIGKVAASLGPILMWVGIIILILILLIGLITFILTGPGLLWNGIKELFKQIANKNWIRSVENNYGAQYIVEKADIENIVGFLDEMGYDIYGYGFINKPANQIFDITNADSEQINETTENALPSASANTYKFIDGGKIYQHGKADAYIDFRKSITMTDMRNLVYYIVSDNASRIIRNSNITVDGGQSGLIDIRDEDNTQLVTERIWKKDFVYIEGNTLKIKPYVLSKKIYNYSLDGWTGRYGIPLEFLLSTHIATMAPDLTYELATSFDTIVKIKLKKDEDAVQKTRVITLDGNAVTYDNINAADNGDRFNKKEAYKFMQKYNIKSLMLDDFNEDVEVNKISNYLCSGYDFSAKDSTKNITKKDFEINADGYINENEAKEFLRLTYNEDDIKDYINSFFSSNANDYNTFFYKTDEKELTKNEIIEKIVNEIKECNYSTTEIDEDKEIFVETRVHNNFLATTEDIYADGHVKERIYNIDSIGEIEFYAENEDEDVKEFTIAIEKEIIDKTETWSDKSRTKQEGTLIITLTVSEDNKKTELTENDLCSSESNTTGKVCSHCRNYCNLLRKACKSASDGGWKEFWEDVKGSFTRNKDDITTVYTPSIVSVTDHWFRNVYFDKAEIEKAIDTDGDGKGDTDDQIVKTDEEYEKQTGERWTEYEMYTDSNGKKQYVTLIYVPNASGEYENVDDYYINNGNYVMCVEVGKGNGNYTLSKKYNKVENGRGEYIYNDKLNDYEYVGKNKGDYECVENKNEYIKVEKGEGEYSLYKWNKGLTDIKDASISSAEPDTFKVGKKAVTQNLSEIWQYTDENGVRNVRETAYEEYTHEPEWTEIEADEDSPESLKNLNAVGGKLEYSLRYTSVKQVEDGVRGQTNSKIKKLFLDDYYLYDGSISTAALIAKAKQTFNSTNPDAWDDKIEKISIYIDEAGKIFDDENGNLFYSEEDEKGNTIENIEPVGKLQKYTASKSDISGPVNILRNSLSAFTILKNIHTLDSEFIYHDFKELIVELDYFDKEDLVEPENETMMFPIPSISSAGWPVGAFDKDESFYGTLIHSAEDLEALRQEEFNNLVESIKDNIGDLEKPENVKHSSPQNSTINGENEQYSNNIFLQAAEDIHKYMEDNSYSYSLDVDKLKLNFEESQNGYPYTCCATFVTWVCKTIGITGVNTHSASALMDQCSKDKHFTIYTYSKNMLQAGDIVYRDGHVQIFAGYDSNGDMTWYNTGGDWSIKQDSPYSNNNNDWIKIARITNWDGLSYNGIAGGSYAEFMGYNGSASGDSEYVVSPVTGEVIKYGTVTRKNIETGEDQDVGFIKIKVLNNELKNEAKAKDSTGGYENFFNEYAQRGIGSYILYIEGIDISDITTVIGSNTDASKLYSYINSNLEACSYKTAYEVPNLLNDELEKELKEEEQAKVNAPYAIDLSNGRILIKEGAVIGKTYSRDSKITTPKKIEKKSINEAGEIESSIETYNIGNYIRLIFRNLNDEVIENVENYIEID